MTAPPNEKPPSAVHNVGGARCQCCTLRQNKSLSPAFFCVAYCSIPLGILRTSSTLMECSLLSRPHLLTRMRLRTSSTSPLGSQCEMLVRANAISAHLGSLYALHRNVVPSRERNTDDLVMNIWPFDTGLAQLASFGAVATIPFGTWFFLCCNL